MLKFHRTQVVWFEIYETTKVAPLFEQLNSIESECEKVLNILNPFLTNEFLSFFEYYKNIPCFYGRRSLEPLSKQDLKHINERIFDFIPQGLKKVRTLSQEINNRIESSKSRNVALGKLEDDLKEILNQIEVIYRKSNASFQDLMKIIDPKTIFKFTDFKGSIYFEENRSLFSDVYQCYKQLEQIKLFLDDLDHSFAKSKFSPDTVLETDVKEKTLESNVLELVPSLEEIVVPSIQGNQDEIEKFLEQKQLQLQLWQRRIAERRAQRHLAPISVPNTEDLEPEPMTVESAKILLDNYAHMSKNSLKLFNSFFAFDPSCKAQNILFRHIESLIEHAGGNISFSKSGSSHFSIQLPNTFSQEAQVQTVGGSFVAHGGDGEWTPRAHQLCRAAFVYAGITAERIEMAKKIMSESKKREMKNA